MKHSKSKKPPAQPQRPPTAPGFALKRWAIIGLALILVAGPTWAFMEFVVWNTLPSELVGKWVVVQGPPEYKEAGFEFHRSGKLIGQLNDNGKLRLMKAEVRVEEDKLYTTTRRPSTGEEHVSVQTIRTLNDRELVLVDEKGNIMRLARFR